MGRGLSGICPGAAYASLGVGNVTVLYAIAGMFLESYFQGAWRGERATADTVAATDD